jgi:peptidoglycan/xylan/chitin deacetylase (PgdA/CDA1 family)
MLWKIGTIISSLLYFSGIVSAYSFYRKRVKKEYRSFVLTYHRIRDDKLDPNITVMTNSFIRQINYILAHFSIQSVHELINSIQVEKFHEKDLFAITFDDGFKDNYDNAFPIIKQRQIPAMIFPVTKFINNLDEYLNTHQILEMKQNNITFGCHTHSHPILSELSIDETRKEISISKNILENILGNKISVFAYPKGKSHHFNETTIKELKNAGFKAAYTNENGDISNSDIYRLPRIGIRECPLFVFKTRVSGIFESVPSLFLRKLLKLT